jgi:hypothetical protein
MPDYSLKGPRNEIPSNSASKLRDMFIIFENIPMSFLATPCSIFKGESRFAFHLQLYNTDWRLCLNFLAFCHGDYGKFMFRLRQKVVTVHLMYNWESRLPCTIFSAPSRIVYSEESLKITWSTSKYILKGVSLPFKVHQGKKNFTMPTRQILKVYKNGLSQV